MSADLLSVSQEEREREKEGRKVEGEEACIARPRVRSSRSPASASSRHATIHFKALVPNLKPTGNLAQSHASRQEAGGERARGKSIIVK